MGKDELWEVVGPVDGDPTTFNSKWSVLVGYIASLELLLMFMTLLSLQDPSRLYTQTWIDSSSTGKHLTNMLLWRWTKQKYPHDPDLRLLWSQLPTVTHKICWVNGHQDRSMPHLELPQNAQLNIFADSLASYCICKQRTND